MAGAVCWRSGEDQRCQSRCLQGVVLFFGAAVDRSAEIEWFSPIS